MKNRTAYKQAKMSVGFLTVVLLRVGILAIARLGDVALARASVRVRIVSASKQLTP